MMRQPRDQVLVTANLSFCGDSVELQVPITTAEVTVAEMLPLFQKLVEDFTHLAVHEAEKAGLAVTCREGCSACCRQLVPISHPEAHSLATIVDALPEPGKSKTRERFREAALRLAGTRIPGALALGIHSRENLVDIGLQYFHLGIPCPFLEKDACSIYEHRPVLCREYLVTSPAEECARPSPETVHKIRTPGQAWNALARLGRESCDGLPYWLPLTMALEWAGTNRVEERRRPGVEILRDFFEFLAEKSNPASPDDRKPNFGAG
jgi:Fe-S-cluster containining protein